MNITVREIKNSKDGFNGRLIRAEERIANLREGQHLE